MEGGPGYSESGGGEEFPLIHFLNGEGQKGKQFVGGGGGGSWIGLNLGKGGKVRANSFPLFPSPQPPPPHPPLDLDSFTPYSTLWMKSRAYLFRTQGSGDR